MFPGQPATEIRPLVADLPGPRRGEGFRPVGRKDRLRLPLARTARTSRSVRQLARALRLVTGALVRAVGRAQPGIHEREVWRSKEGAGRTLPAFRTIAGRSGVGHRPHLRERTAIRAFVVVERHSSMSLRVHRSGASGTSIEPSRNFVGPSAPGIRSYSKTSVGSHSVAQAFGMSTTPEICPCTGAVPRIA